MIVRVGFQRPDAEIEIPRREQNQESGVFLLLRRNGLGEKPRNSGPHRAD
jgi:hypothetical protein